MFRAGSLVCHGPVLAVAEPGHFDLIQPGIAFLPEDVPHDVVAAGEAVEVRGGPPLRRLVGACVEPVTEGGVVRATAPIMAGANQSSDHKVTASRSFTKICFPATTGIA